MKKKPIVIDIDNTLLDFSSAFIDYLLREYPDETHMIKHKLRNKYDYGLGKFKKDIIYDFYDTPQFKDLLPFANCEVFTHLLSYKYKIYIVSAANEKLYDIRKKNLDKYNIYYDELILNRNKINDIIKIKPEFCIDDAPYMFEDFDKYNINYIIKSWKYNDKNALNTTKNCVGVFDKYSYLTRKLCDVNYYYYSTENGITYDYFSTKRLHNNICDKIIKNGNFKTIKEIKVALSLFYLKMDELTNL